MTPAEGGGDARRHRAGAAGAGHLGGSAFVLPLAWLGPLACLGLAALLFLAGLWAVRRLSRAGAERDPGWVVVDEGAGQLLALSAIPAGAPWLWVVLSFALVPLLRYREARGPVGWADRRKGFFWVMLDDLVAGAMAAGATLAVAGGAAAGGRGC